MAPEILNGHPYNYKADMYSLGVSIYKVSFLLNLFYINVIYIKLIEIMILISLKSNLIFNSNILME
jgi:serine/threonine protein kinase